MSMTIEQMRAEGRARPPLGAGEGSAKEWQRIFIEVTCSPQARTATPTELDVILDVCALFRCRDRRPRLSVCA